MDYIREMLNMGGNIMQEVNDAIDRGDYSNLASSIRRQVSSFSEGMRGNGSSYYRGGYRPVDIDLGTRPKGTTQGASKQNQKTQNSYKGSSTGAYSYGKVGGGSASSFTGKETGAGYNAGAAYDERRRQQNAKWNYSAARNNQKSSERTSTSTAITPFNANKPSGAWTSATLKQIFGGMGLVFTIPATVAMLITAATVGAPSLIAGTAAMAIGTGVAGYFTGKGTSEKKLNKTFDAYDRLIGGAEYADIKSLAGKANETPEAVTKNLDNMIDSGLLPQARYDAGKTTLMLTQNAYDQYVIAEDARREREEEEARMDKFNVSSESRQVIKEGEAFVVKIRKANDLIPGEEMTAKLDQLERIVNKIFSKVKQEPETASDLRKFMSYYLPTTEKLMNAYIELDKQPEVGDNIKNTKRDIEEAIDTINDAFENLLDSLFEETAWDISSDISVMKTMMEQDGLMNKKNMKADSSFKNITDMPTPEDK